MAAHAVKYNTRYKIFSSSSHQVRRIGEILQESSHHGMQDSGNCLWRTVQLESRLYHNYTHCVTSLL